MRLDVWLDITCLFKTRSEAQKAVKGGKVDVNGQSGKPQKELKAGDVLEITRPLGRKQRVVVRGFAEQHIAKAEARKLYEDVTPAAVAGRSRNAAVGSTGPSARPRRRRPGPPGGTSGGSCGA